MLAEQSRGQSEAMETTDQADWDIASFRKFTDSRNSRLHGLSSATLQSTLR